MRNDSLGALNLLGEDLDTILDTLELLDDNLLVRLNISLEDSLLSLTNYDNSPSLAGDSVTHITTLNRCKLQAVRLGLLTQQAEQHLVSVSTLSANLDT